MDNYGIWSLLPPVGALGLALCKKQIYPALLLGVWLGWWILDEWNPIFATGSTVTAIIHVFSDTGSTHVLIYSLMVGAMLALINATGGVAGFVKWLELRSWVRTRRRAQLVPFMVGFFITVESSITSLVAGTVGRPLTDRFKVSREKLSYICDSTSAPICILVPFNGWGAYVIGLLAVQGVESPVNVLFRSVAVNFYPMAAILIVFFTIVSQRDFGPMRVAELRARQEGKVFGDDAHPMVSNEVIGVEPMAGISWRPINFIAPVVTMIVSIVVGIYLTGRARAGSVAGSWEIIEASSGSTAVLCAVIMSLVTIALLNLGRGLPLRAFVDLTFKGMRGMIPVVTLLLLAFALGDVVRQLGTGLYIAGLVAEVASMKVAVVGLFFIACCVAFSTGTSWGTFAVMIPIAVPLATALGGNLPLFLAAVLGGGVFGDHCSPISDTTIISSMASASDHMDHVRTQIPYATVGAVLTTVLYMVVA